MPPSELTFLIRPGTEPVEAIERALDYLCDELDMLEMGDALSKAIPALHHSQTQQRQRTGKFATRHHAHTQARTARGRFRGRLTLDEREAAVDQAGTLINKQLEPRLQRHLRDFTGGKITSADWYDRCEMDLRFFYEEAYKSGQRSVGHASIAMTPQDKAILNRLMKDELHYLGRFRDDLDAGRGRMPYPQRLSLYAQATWESYWYGWLTGDQRKTRRIRWMYGATVEHCGIAEGGERTGCSDFVAIGWMTAVDAVKNILTEGFAPRSGKLECGGFHCLCTLQESVDGKVGPLFTYPDAPKD